MWSFPKRQLAQIKKHGATILQLPVGRASENIYYRVSNIIPTSNLHQDLAKISRNSNMAIFDDIQIIL